MAYTQLSVHSNFETEHRIKKTTYNMVKTVGYN